MPVSRIHDFIRYGVQVWRPVGDSYLSVQAWQEKLGKNFDGIKVNGEPATWKRGRIALNLKPDETLNLDVEIPAAVLQ